MNKRKFDFFIAGELTQAEAGEELFDIFKEPLMEEMGQIREQLKGLKYSEEQQTDDLNVIIFGPSGAGKSSLIRSLFNAVNDAWVPLEKISSEIVVKGAQENEGTTKFSCFRLREGVKSSMTIAGKQYVQGTLGINLFDTRGQITMNRREESEMKALMQVS